MGLFGKKKENENKVSKDSEEFVLKEELEKEVEELQELILEENKRN